MSMLDTETAASPLATARARADALLDNLPPGRLDAKRMIEQELGLALRAEELQAIEAIAVDRQAGGVMRELPRSVLAVRVLAEEQLAIIGWESLDAQAIRNATEMLRIVLDERRLIEDTLREEFGSDSELPISLVQKLGELCESLLPDRQRIVATLMLAPRLEALAVAIETGDPRTAAPTIDETEAALLLATGPAGDPRRAAPPRVCIDAIVLRTLIEEDLQKWHWLAAEDGSEAVLQARRTVFEHFTRDKLTYEVVNNWLQSAQDTALKARDENAAELIRTARGRLFAQYLKIVPILRRGTASIEQPIVADAPSTLSQTAADLLGKSAEADRASDKVVRGRARDEELYLEALKKERQPRLQSFLPGEDALLAERKRRKVLGIVAGVAFVAALGVQVWYFAGRDIPQRIEVTAGEFTRFLPVTKVNPIGTMLYARVDGWQHFSDQDRIDRTQQLAAAAAAKGFSNVYVVDTAGEALARWNATEGVKLEAVPIDQQAGLRAPAPATP